jgi:hypothetical protein
MKISFEQFDYLVNNNQAIEFYDTKLHELKYTFYYYSNDISTIYYFSGFYGKYNHYYVCKIDNFYIRDDNFLIAYKNTKRKNIIDSLL